MAEVHRLREQEELISDGDGSATRATWHRDAGCVVISLWRGDACVATSHLTPGEAGRLASFITGGLAELAVEAHRDGPGVARVAESRSRPSGSTTISECGAGASPFPWSRSLAGFASHSVGSTHQAGAGDGSLSVGVGGSSAGPAQHDRIPQRLRYHQPRGVKPTATRSVRIRSHPNPAQRRRAWSGADSPSPTQRKPAPIHHRKGAGGGEGQDLVHRASPEFDHQRLWADLLSSEASSFNLFGDLAADPKAADRAVHIWWAGCPGHGGRGALRPFAGPTPPAYLNSLRAFDVAYVLYRGDGARGVLGIDVRYHEWAKPEIPKPSNMPRYVEVAGRSGVFGPGAVEDVEGKSALCEMWLEHLLLLSMLQHESDTCSWGRYVVVHPADNSDFEEACARYRGLLVDTSTFASVTVEELLDAEALPKRTTAALRRRYLPG